MLIRVLLAVSEARLQERLRRLLSAPGAVIESVGPGRDRWLRITKQSADLVIVGRGLVPEPAADSVRVLRDSPESPDVIVVTSVEDVEERSRLLAAGCEAVLSPKVGDDLLRDLFRTVLERRRSDAGNRIRLGPAVAEPSLEDFVSESPAMQAFLDVVKRVVDTDASLLILGETGVGKERLARAVHAESPRSRGPFVAVNCGALPETLLESELFGHAEGAFTGATRARRGWFELAHGGSIFLDEIGEMPLHLQVKLLRVLQEREFLPLGSERSVRIDVRVMAASNRDLARSVEIGEFRRDLFYRLCVVTLTLPPLRERREDVPTLVQSYVDHFRGVIGRNVDRVVPAALAALTRYSWPGNVRELMNVVERATLLCDGPEIGLAHLPDSIGGAPAPPPASASLAGAAGGPRHWSGRAWRAVRKEAMEEVERAYFDALLADTAGRIGETARLAGIEPRSLYEKMRRLGLRKEDYRPDPEA